MTGDPLAGMELQERLREDELQALITLVELAEPIETPNNNSYRFHPATIADAKTYFRRFALELSPAWRDLGVKGLVHGQGDLPHLTELGRALAREIRVLRPPIWYWYSDFYAAIEGSTAFSTYAERVLGRDLSQHGFADVPQIERLVSALKLGPSSRVLDTGCGNGRIAEYVSDSTGARVTGVDYVPRAIAQAIHRARPKSDRLRFVVANLDTLELPRGSFDVVVSVDSIFFGRDLEETLKRLAALLAPGGRMGILCGCDLSPALRSLDLEHDETVLDREHYEHLKRKRRVASELRPLFEREGIAFVWENLMAESIDDTAPFDPGSESFRRRLSVVRLR